MTRHLGTLFELLLGRRNLIGLQSDAAIDLHVLLVLALALFLQLQLHLVIFVLLVQLAQPPAFGGGLVVDIQAAVRYFSVLRITKDLVQLPLVLRLATTLFAFALLHRVLARLLFHPFVSLLKLLLLELLV